MCLCDNLAPGLIPLIAGICTELYQDITKVWTGVEGGERSANMNATQREIAGPRRQQQRENEFMKRRGKARDE